jgi:hypothetical protein
MNYKMRVFNIYLVFFKYFYNFIIVRLRVLNVTDHRMWQIKHFSEKIATPRIIPRGCLRLPLCRIGMAWAS